jgi:hypothetical protein
VPSFRPSSWPVAILADRYQGTYSGGEWLAVANADILIGDELRVAWLLSNGPGDDDLRASDFWFEAKAFDWIAVGDTPEAALRALDDKFVVS